MSAPGVLVGLGATKAAWSAQLRSFVRDHMTGITAETVLDGRQLARSGRRRLDVLVVDDVTRVFAAGDVGAAVAAGTVVIGLYDTEAGLGRAYLEGLGVSRLLPVSVATAELAAVIAEVGPINAGPTSASDLATPTPPSTLGAGRRGSLTVLSAVSGGVGLTETLIGLAACWAGRGRVLVIEANPLAATLAARLRRDPAYGLGWALGRLAQGRRALPEGLSPPLDGAAGVGGFDVVCQSGSPGGPPVVNPVLLQALVGEGLVGYDHVLVEAGPLLVAPPSGGSDRFSAGRAALAAADRVVVLAGPDPESAARLVAWRAAAAEVGVTAPAWAIFARVATRGAFEVSQLTGLVETSTGAADFADVGVLPEDPVVARARWNGELVWRGRWRKAVDRLAADLAAAPVVAASPVPMTGRRVSLASEAGW